MAKSFNSTQRLICHLCGCDYIESEGHGYNDCAGRIKERLIELRDERRALENNYAEAYKRAKEGK